jgi:hypothetical protein
MPAYRFENEEVEDECNKSDNTGYQELKAKMSEADHEAPVVSVCFAEEIIHDHRKMNCHSNGQGKQAHNEKILPVKVLLHNLQQNM